MIHIG